MSDLFPCSFNIITVAGAVFTALAVIVIAYSILATIYIGYLAIAGAIRARVIRKYLENHGDPYSTQRLRSPSRHATEKIEPSDFRGSRAR